MPDRRSRLPAGTRAASQRAAQKVFENELALAELAGEDRVRLRVREVLQHTTTTRINGVEVEVVPVALVERALTGAQVPPQANDQRTVT